MKVPAHVVSKPASSGTAAQAFLRDLQPSLLQSYQKKLKDAKIAAKHQPVVRSQNEPNGLYFFLRSNLELRSARYWSPPVLVNEDSAVTNPVTTSSVSVDGYFQQTDGDSSFIATPYWFRLKNRRDFYTHDEFMSVLLTEAYWEQQLVKVVANPSQPPLRRKGWNNWTRLSVKDKSGAPATAAVPASSALGKAQKANNIFLVSEGENSELVALRRPFRQRFFALFRAITDDFNGDAFIDDWVNERVAELKVGLKLWLNPDLLTAHGVSIPNSYDALKPYFPAGKLTRHGFLPSALQFLSFGGVYQYQFPLPYNLLGKLHIHPNFTTALQQQHHLDLSNTGNVFYSHNSWQPVNEKRVGNTYAGYLTDAAHNAKASVQKDSKKLVGFENTARVESVNAIISSLWTYFLRRRFFTTRPSPTDLSLAFNEIGLPIYRRRDTVPFGLTRLKLFKKRTWKQLYPTGDPSSMSSIWSLRPNTRGLQLTEDVLNTSTNFEPYFKNVDRKVPDFAHVVVKSF